MSPVRGGGEEGTESGELLAVDGVVPPPDSAMTMAAELLFDHGLKSHQKDTDPKLARCQNGPFHFGARSVVSSHRIKSDGDQLGSDRYQL